MYQFAPFLFPTCGFSNCSISIGVFALASVNGSEQLGHWGGGIASHRRDDGRQLITQSSVLTGVRGDGVDGEAYSSSGSSGACEAAVSRLRFRRQLSPFISRMWTWWVSRSTSAPVSLSVPKTSAPLTALSCARIFALPWECVRGLKPLPTPSGRLR